MDIELKLIKLIHIISAILLFGTGLGSAYYKWRADRNGNLALIYHTNRHVVLADWIFTTPTVIVQPLTGIWLAVNFGYPLMQGWIFWALCLYFLAGACWLPVVYLQIRMKNLSQTALESAKPLPRLYHRMAAWWFGLGIPAFSAMVAVLYLMVFRP